MKIKINDNTLLIIEILILTLLGFGQIFSISALNLSACVLLAILMLLSKLEISIVLLFTALPFFNLFNSSMGNTSLYYIYILIFIGKYLRKKEGKIPKNKFFLLFVFLILRFSSGSFLLLLKWICLFSVLILTYKEDFFSKNIKKIINSLTISFLLSSIFGYYMLNKGISIYTGSYVYSTVRFGGLVGDSVFFAQFAVVIASLNYILLNFNFNLKNFIWIVLLHFFIILTYSKTGILLTILMFIIYIYSVIIKNSKNQKTLIKSLILMYFLPIIIFSLYNYISKHTDNIIISNYLGRFNSKDLTTGRIDIINHYIQLLKNDFSSLFVAMNLEKYYTPFYPNNNFIFPINRAHNIYIECLCAFGIIPTIIIFIWIIKNIFLLLQRKNWCILILPLLMIIATGFSLHGNFEFHYYTLLALAFAVFDKNTDYFLSN